jgi:hypothetical protein
MECLHYIVTKFAIQKQHLYFMSSSCASKKFKCLTLLVSQWDLNNLCSKQLWNRIFCDCVGLMNCNKHSKELTGLSRAIVYSPWGWYWSIAHCLTTLSENKVWYVVLLVMITCLVRILCIDSHVVLQCIETAHCLTTLSENNVWYVVLLVMITCLVRILCVDSYVVLQCIETELNWMLEISVKRAIRRLFLLHVSDLVYSLKDSSS